MAKAKRIVDDRWYKSNGIPVPSANLTKTKAIELVNACQSAKTIEEIKNLVKSAK